MAISRTMKRGDTYPPLKGWATDETGAMPLASAVSMKVLLQCAPTLITGSAIATVSTDSSGATWNWAHVWASGETNAAGTWVVELEIDWGSGQVQTVPNTGHDQVVIEADLGGIRP